MRRLLLVLLAAGLLAAVPAGGLAAGGVTLAVDPASPVLGQSFVLSGDGYPTPTSISFEVTGPRKSGIHYFTAGEPLDAASGGHFEESWLAWWGVAGDYQITSYYRDSKGSTHKAAVVKFTVVAP